MTGPQKMVFIRAVSKAIFNSKRNGTDITKVRINHPNITTIFKGIHCAFGRWFVNGTLRGFDIDLNIGHKVLRLRFLEQNPNKRDNYGNLKTLASLAQQGHQIMWVIDRVADKGFIGRLQDGEWIPAQQYAYTNYTGQSGQVASQDRAVNNAQVVPPETNIPEYVVQNVGLGEEVEIPDEYRR